MSDSFIISSAPAIVQKATKPKILNLICEAIKITGVPRKGSSYKSIRNWVSHNLGTEISSSRLTASMKRAFDTLLEKEVLGRPSKYKDNVGLTGWFILIKKDSPQKRNELAKKIKKKSIQGTKKLATKSAAGKPEVVKSAPTRSKPKAETTKSNPTGSELKPAAAKSASAVVKSKVAATKSAATGTKSRVAATKRAPTGAKSKVAATKSAPKVAKPKAAATKSAPTGAKSKAVATTSAPAVAKSEVAATKSAPTVAKSEVAATKSASSVAKSKVVPTKSAPTGSKSKIATIRTAPKKIETKTEKDSSSTEHSDEAEMVMSSPTETKSKASPKRALDIEISPEKTDTFNMPKQAHKAAKVKPGTKTAKSKLDENTKVRKLYTDSERPTADLPRKDLSDTELEVKRTGRKSMKSYSSDTDLTIVAKETAPNKAKQKRKTQKLKGKL